MSPSFTSAATVEEALAALGDGARPIAGGTDLVVGARQGKAPLPEAVVAIDRLEGLRGIRREGDDLVLGTLTTHADLVEDATVREHLTAIADASAIVGSHATRAQGTIGGNVMNASPAMDTGAPLLCLGATATLLSVSGERAVALDELWTGPGRTSAEPGELLTADPHPAPARGQRVELRPPRIPPPDGDRRRRCGRRGHARRWDGPRRPGRDHGAHARDPAGGRRGVGPRRHRRRRGTRSRLSADAAAAAATPISDVRGSADYRRAMAEVIARRAITAALARARGASVPIPASPALFGTTGASL